MRSLRVFQGFRDFDRKGGRTVDILRFDGGDTDLLQYIIHIYVMVHLHNWLLCIITGFYT